MNEGVSCVIAFGQFEGGELQVLIGKDWQNVNCVGSWRDLDPKCVHRVLPVTAGKRYSLVLYNPQGVFEKVSEQDLLRLRSHGFKVEAGRGLDLSMPVQEKAKQIWSTLKSSVDAGMGQLLTGQDQQAFPAQETPVQLLPESMTHPFPASSEMQLQNSIAKCHDKMGHPHQAQFLRILRTAGASSKVLTLAKDLRCSVCSQHGTPVPHRQSAVLPCMSFNQVVGVDLFFVLGPDGHGQVPVLSMICWGTLFQICVLLKDKTARRVRKAYRRNWLRVFGPPRKLVSDQGGEFTGAEFAERLETDGSIHELIPGDAPWQNGRTERHGGTVKLLLTKARMTCPPRSAEDLEELLCSVTQAKNMYTLVGGFSPHQR
eukprot:6455085-Amphidinium_carterae.1